MITAERLRELLSYDPESGVFIWRGPTLGHRVQGAIAGALAADRKGKRNVLIGLDRSHYLAHRLAWLYVTGMWPRYVIDHINGNPMDNRLSNLREATSSQNNWNSSINSKNTSGFKGVHWDRSKNKWVARVKMYGKPAFFKRFDSKEDAIKAVTEARLRLHGEFARLN